MPAAVTCAARSMTASAVEADMTGTLSSRSFVHGESEEKGLRLGDAVHDGQPGAERQDCVDENDAAANDDCQDQRNIERQPLAAADDLLAIDLGRAEERLAKLWLRVAAGDHPG